MQRYVPGKCAAYEKENISDLKGIRQNYLEDKIRARKQGRDGMVESEGVRKRTLQWMEQQNSKS